MRPLDVLWISDEEIKPPGPKMVVCVEPTLGFYFRINSHSDWQPCVPIIKEPDHTFLRWDSFIECTILDPDDYIINQAIEKGGMIGRVSLDVCNALIEKLPYVMGNLQDKNAIRAALEPLL